jgi:1,4-alpha-glucan branching enzyme
MSNKTESLMQKNPPLKRKQTFTYQAPAALSVQLAGDFTEWEKHPISLQRKQDGLWQATVELNPGAHRYRFLVDGEWQDDPACTIFVPNPFGSRDSVREVARGN